MNLENYRSCVTKLMAMAHKPQKDERVSKSIICVSALATLAGSYLLYKLFRSSANQDKPAETLTIYKPRNNNISFVKNDREKDSSMESRLIVITGASSGFGAACVLPFAFQGHSVLMLARNVENMKKVKESIVKQVGKECESRIYIKKCDVTNVEPKRDQTNNNNNKSNTIVCHSISSAIEECICENSNDKCKLYCDCLINNAGSAFFDSIETQAWYKIESMIETNIKGVLNGMRSVIKDMKSRKQGTIINMSSMAGKSVMTLAPIYSSTKFAIHALTEALRQEVANYNVKVCVICPGAAATNILNNEDEGNENIKTFIEWGNSLNLGILMPQDVANACYFMYNQHPRCCIRELHIASVNQLNP